MVADKAKTLEESAREFQARTERHVEIKEVDVVTGEEGESNVLQVGVLSRAHVNMFEWTELL